MFCLYKMFILALFYKPKQNTMIKWSTTINYTENGIDYQQEFDAPFLPNTGDIIMAFIKKADGTLINNVCFKVKYITFSLLTNSIRINII